MVAVKISNSADIKFIGGAISGFDVAFEVDDSVDVSLEGVDISRTRVAVKGERVKGFKAVDVTHSKGEWNAFTPLAYAIRRASYGNV